MKNLSIKLFGKTFKNPLFLPSGIIQEIPDHKRAQEAGVGAVVLKSITLERREGNPIPRVIRCSTGIMNSVGLKNPGLIEAKKQIKKFIKQSKIPVIVSVFGTKVKDFQKLVAEVSKLKPFAIELNLSCPNVSDEFGEMLASQKDSSYKVTKFAKKEAGRVPIICKLSPNIANIGEIAKACEAAGADAISAINTIGLGMVIDIKTRKPVLGAKKGGVSGPGIKPVAIAKVYEIYESVKIPILGMGGITTWEDVVEMMLAGATLVGVGSAVYLKGYGVYQEILKGLGEFLKKEKIKNIKSLVGAAH